jgi:hypothetical protein
VSSYSEFLSKKLTVSVATGFTPHPQRECLFFFQRDLVRWALQRGRAAIFASTGLGKTRMQLEWARQVYEHTKRPVLILAPLAVAAQTQEEGAAIGVHVIHAREQEQAAHGVTITNYERLHKFDASQFSGVVLDESSCIKHHATKTLDTLLKSFSDTPFKLCATATPAPNDWTELGTHAEFLGVCSRVEMLAEFFTHDGGDTSTWRLKGHARRQFWKWVASWGALVRSPEDLGYDGSDYKLPPLSIVKHTINVDKSDVFSTGELFPRDVLSMSERRNARRASLEDRVSSAASVVNASKEPWVLWCDLNDESKALIEAIPDAVEVTGSDDIEDKEQRLLDFAAGKIRVLVTKPSIAGFGLNWQHCARMGFVGVTDSWESYFQAIRRCWRFGQKRSVEAHVFISEMEGPVIRNLERKAADAEKMAAELSKETSEAVSQEVRGTKRTINNTDHQQQTQIPSWIHTEKRNDV